MGEKKTHAILLRKTLLANDDAVLEFFTAEWGRVSIFVKKFAQSKKRAEIDFFRLLELEIFEGRSSKSLRNATTISLFSGFEESFALAEMGFLWLKALQRNLPEEKPIPQFFGQTVKFFKHFSNQEKRKLDASFRTKLLVFSGVFPHFDQIRSNVFFDPQTSQISKTETPHAIKISNLSRQIIEFLRQSTFEEFWDKKEKLSEKNFGEVEILLAALEQFHN